MKFSLYFLVFFFSVVGFVAAQSNDANGIVSKLLQDVANGKLEKVKDALPTLAQRFPKDPAVLYLQASCSNTMDDAISLFSEIVRSYPMNMFADDALFSLFQLAVTEKDISAATEYYKKLQKDYPNSPLLVPAYNLIRLTGVGTMSIEPPIAEKAVRGNESTQKIDEKTTSTTSMFPKKNVEVSTMPKKPITVTTEIPKKIDTVKATPETVVVSSQTKTEPSKPKSTPVQPKTNQTTSTKATSQNQIKPKSNKSGSTFSATTPKYIVDNSPTKGYYFLQAASYKNKEVAEKQLQKYKPIKRRIIEKKKGENILYIIALGKYTTKESAISAQPTVEEQCKCQTFVIQE
jgi:cell division protein FtsN